MEDNPQKQLDPDYVEAVRGMLTVVATPRSYTKVNFQRHFYTDYEVAIVTSVSRTGLVRKLNFGDHRTDVALEGKQYLYLLTTLEVDLVDAVFARVKGFKFKTYDEMKDSIKGVVNDVRSKRKV